MLITTGHLEISDCRSNDLVTLHRILADPRISAPFFMGMTPKFDYGFPEENKITLVAKSPMTGKIIGSVELKDSSLGYFIDPDFWGRGYGNEIVQACCGYLFSRHDIDEIHARVLRENLPSKRILERAGFRFRGMEKLNINKSVEISLLRYSSIISQRN